MRRFIAVVYGLAAMAVGLACSSDTAILLRIDTELRVPAELNGVRIRVASDVKPLLDEKFAIGSQDEFPTTYRIVAENDREVPVTMTVDGLHDSETVAEAVTRATFVKGETIDAEVFLKKGTAPQEDGGTDAATTDRGPMTEDGGMQDSDQSDAPTADADSDAVVDAGVDPVDAAELSDRSESSDGSGPSDTSDVGFQQDVPDAGATDDAGGDGGVADDATQDTGVADDATGYADTGSVIGAACEPDAGCGPGLECMTDGVPGGYCTTLCELSACPEGSACLSGLVPDASFCARTCAANPDCEFRPGFACVQLSAIDASICGPGPADGGYDGGIDAGADAGACPRVELTLVDPANGKVGVGQTATFSAEYFDASCAKDPAAVFSWLSETHCASFADPAVGEAVGEFIEPACVIHASANNTTGITTVSVEAVVTTFSGSGVEGFQDGAPGVAQFNKLTFGSSDNYGALVVVDVVNQTATFRIRRIDASGDVSTLADNVRRGCVDGDSSTYSITSIGDVAAGGLSGEIYFSDPGCNALRKLSAGNVETLVSSPAGFVDGDAGTAKINTPKSLALTGGALFFFDSLNYAIRMLNLSTNSVSTFAGSGIQGHKDGAALDAFINGVQGLALHGTYTLLFTDWPGYIRYSDGSVVGTLGGTTNVGFKDGPLATAEFNEINNIVVLDDGTVFVSDAFNHSVRKIDFDKSWISTVAGGSCSCFADGVGSEAGFFYPQNIIAARSGPVLFVLDQFNYRVRKVRVSRY